MQPMTSIAMVVRHPDYENVLVMTIAGNVTMSQALNAAEQESKLIMEADRVLHTIIDLRETVGVPANFISNMPRIAQMPAASHPNAGQKIVVGARGMAGTVLNIFSRVYRKLDMVATMEEAYRIIDGLNAPSEQP
jgi:hypothetical protein